MHFYSIVIGRRPQTVIHKLSCSMRNFSKYTSIALLIATPSFLSAQESEQSDESNTQTREILVYESLGWTPAHQLSDEQRELLAPGCSGRYIDPQQDLNLTLKQSLNEPLIVEAAHAEVVAGDQAEITGSVEVSQGSVSVTAESMNFDRESQSAVLAGEVTIRQPGMGIQGNRAEIQFRENKSRFEGSQFVIHDAHFRGSAEVISQDGPGRVVLENGAVTSCEPGDNTWLLSGGKITIDQNTQQGTGRNVKLTIGSVPVLYLPYISFPIGDERKSGFLFPTINSSEDGGIDIALPYYWNIAPNYDATLTPRLITGRGFQFGGEFRHLSKWALSELQGEYLADDEGSQDNDLQRLIDRGEVTEAVANPNKGSDRWLIGLNQRGGGTRGLYIFTDFTRVSDIDYFRDLGASSFSSDNNSQLDQIFQLGYRFDHWDISTLFEKHQLLVGGITDPYQKLPQIAVDGDFQTRGFTAQLNHEFTQFESDQASPAIDGRRAVLDYRINWENHSSWWTLSPEIGYKYLNYDLESSDGQVELTGPENQNYGAFQAGLDASLRFERSSGKYRQTLEPRLFYFYREFEDQSDLFNVLGGQDVNFDTFFQTFSYEQLFRDSRFIGSDRLDDADRITLGLSTAFFNNQTQEEVFRLSLGKIYYREDRRIFLDTILPEDSEETGSSEVALESAWRVSRDIDLVLNGVYDTRNDRTNRSSARIHYADPDRNHIVNLSYVRNQTDTPGQSEVGDLEQADFSFATKVAPQWSVFGRVNYDIDIDRELETFLGFEYDDCCYRARVLLRRSLDSNIVTLTDDQDSQFDQGIFFEITLKGLGGSGSTTNKILEDGIFGFKSRNGARYK